MLNNFNKLYFFKDLIVKLKKFAESFIIYNSRD